MFGSPVVSTTGGFDKSLNDISDFDTALHTQTWQLVTEPTPSDILERMSRRIASMWLALWGSVVLSTHAHAALLIPNQLTQSDRQEALRIIGFGTSSKALSDPYPLGGHLGLELGLSLETVPTEDLGRLGSRLAAPQADVTIPKFTIGKGLFNDLDMYIHFMPYNQRNELSQYGGLLRWSFYEAPALPVSASIATHFNSANINNQLTLRTYGLDLMSGITVNEVSLYIGAGILQSFGSFMGGSAGVTDTQRLETEAVSSYRTLAGAQIRLNPLFIALQVDRSNQSVMSAKLGMRF